LDLKGSALVVAILPQFALVCGNYAIVVYLHLKCTTMLFFPYVIRLVRDDSLEVYLIRMCDPFGVLSDNGSRSWIRLCIPEGSDILKYILYKSPHSCKLKSKAQKYIK